MAPMLFRGLKGVTISCASPASTAICSNIDQWPPMHGGRPLDRHQTRRLGDAHRTKALNTLPFFPKPKSHDKQKSGRKSSSSSDKPTHLISPASSSRCLLPDDSSFFDAFPDLDPLPGLIQFDPSRFHSIEGDGSFVLAKPSSSFKPKDHVNLRSASASSSSSSSSSTSIAAADVTNTSTNWARFPMIEIDESGVLKQPAPVVSKKQISFRNSTSSAPSLTRFQTVKGDEIHETPVLKPSFSARSRDQVVVLRVSLHCKGCEGKVRKHLSRMQGVTSFNIDFAAKKVTVIGDVTPLGVLSSISKVKNAQFWPSPPSLKH